MQQTIILVEDDPGIQDALSLAFTNSSCKVIVYPDAHEILNGNFHPPVLFIIDKQLPGVDGLELCKHLKQNEQTRHIPVIIVSASPRMEKQSMMAGANEFVEKPFKLTDLREIVSRYLGSV